MQYSSPGSQSSNKTSATSTLHPPGEIDNIIKFGRFEIDLNFGNKIVEKFFLHLGFYCGFKQHKYFNDLSVDIVEYLKLLEEDDWDMFIGLKHWNTDINSTD